jgi:arsenate reductase
MTSKITVYEKPTCSTCRAVDKILREAGEDYDKINYYVEPIGEAKLRELLKKLNMRADELVRKKEDVYKQLEIGTKNLSEDELIKLMARHPDLIQRPIVERGDKAVLARPPENIREIL